MVVSFSFIPFDCLAVWLTRFRGHFIDYLLERPDVAPVFERMVSHPFVLAMGDGTLPLESFKGYLMQDYVYLVCYPPVSSPGPLLTCQIHFARANALASYKAASVKDIAAVCLPLGMAG
jgi:hypothetical protein